MSFGKFAMRRPKSRPRIKSAHRPEFTRLEDRDLLATVAGTLYDDTNGDGRRSGIGTTPVPEITPVTPGPIIIQKTDDTGSVAVPLGFTVNFYGSQYTTLYVNNNGNVSFRPPHR